MTMFCPFLSSERSISCFVLRLSLFPALPQQKVERGHSQESQPKLAKRMFCTIWCCAQSRAKNGVEEEGTRRSGFQGSCFSNTGWASACLVEVLNDFLCFACWFNFYSFFHQLIYLHPCISLSSPMHFLAFVLPIFSPHPSGNWSESAGWRQSTTQL